ACLRNWRSSYASRDEQDVQAKMKRSIDMTRVRPVHTAVQHLGPADVANLPAAVADPGPDQEIPAEPAALAVEGEGAKPKPVKAIPEELARPLDLKCHSCHSHFTANTHVRGLTTCTNCKIAAPIAVQYQCGACRNLFTIRPAFVGHQVQCPSCELLL